MPDFDVADLDPTARKTILFLLRHKRGEARRTRKGGTPKEPRGLQTAYTRFLIKVSAQISTAIESAIASSLEVAARRERLDANLDGLPLERIFAGLRVRLGRLVEAPDVVRLVDQFGRRINRDSTTDLAKVLRLELSTLTPEIQEALGAFRRENVALIRSIADTQLAQVETLVNEAATSGMRVETLRNRIQERFQVSRSRAQLIARDQVLKTNAQLTQVRHASVGVIEYEWVTSKDERVRETHQALDGTIQRWDSPPVTNDNGDTNHPGEDFQCRCVARPIIPF